VLAAASGERAPSQPRRWLATFVLAVGAVLFAYGMLRAMAAPSLGWSVRPEAGAVASLALHRLVLPLGPGAAGPEVTALGAWLGWALLIAGGAGTGLLLARARRLAAVGVGWFCLGALAVGIASPPGAARTDAALAFCSLGPALASGLALARVADRRRGMAALTAVLVAGAVGFEARLLQWRNDASLWTGQLAAQYDNADWQRRAGHALLRRNNPERARTHLRLAATGDPRDGSSLVLLAHLALSDRDTTTTAALLDEFFAKAPGGSWPDALQAAGLDTRARLLLTHGDPEGARREARAAVRLAPDNEGIRELWARLEAAATTRELLGRNAAP
jgi:tetratricopeptide (TPR) repeat protein